MVAKKSERQKSADKLMQFISKKAGRAIADYHLLKNGDKIIVAVSGGKDSLTLLKLLKYRQSFVPIKYDILAVYIDFGNCKIQSKALEKFCKNLGVKFCIKKVKLPKGKPGKNNNCFWCSWNRRKVLFQLARKNGCNKVALGHHLDDIVETVLLNLFYQGQISAMKPKQELFDGDITIIRPLAYVEEKEISNFVKSVDDFPYKTCTCQNAIDSKRVVVEKIIKELSQQCPQVKKNIFRSSKRIKKDYLL